MPLVMKKLPYESPVLFVESAELLNSLCYGSPKAPLGNVPTEGGEETIWQRWFTPMSDRIRYTALIPQELPVLKNLSVMPMLPA